MIGVLVSLFLSFLFFATPINGVECSGSPPSGSDKINEINEYIEKCAQKISELKKEQTSLKQAIDTINSKINLAQGQINQTLSQIEALEKEIGVLGGVLDKVNESTTILTKIYLARVQETYRRIRVNQTDLLFSTENFGDYFTKLKYLNTVKSKDQLILSELERSRLDYDNRRQSKLEKQQEIEKLKQKMEAQKRDLSIQQNEKQNLLITTANDEKKFQALLSAARSELLAIEAIIAGNVDETEVGDVSTGQRIATVIDGKSCNSGGAHLHFIVSNNGNVQNPFNSLKNVDFENCSGSSCGSGNGDTFNPSGSWDWPLSPKITLNQGYGSTWAVKNTWVGKIYSFHNGIDIEGENLEVKAVQSGKLFRGSYSGANGCSLKYVHVKHKDGGLDTFYLHVNYF